MKPKPCAHCGSFFLPPRPMAQVCSPICASRLVKAKKAEAKADVKRRKEAVKTLSQHKADAQRAINAWVVHGRDKDEACISCGGNGGGVPYQAGHYRTRGSSPHLALDERNLAKQCVRCNLHQHGAPIGFRAGLVARHGEAFVQELEADQTPRKYTADELVSIKSTYRAKLKALQKEEV